MRNGPNVRVSVWAERGFDFTAVLYNLLVAFLIPHFTHACKVSQKMISLVKVLLVLNLLGYSLSVGLASITFHFTK